MHEKRKWLRNKFNIYISIPIRYTKMISKIDCWLVFQTVHNNSTGIVLAKLNSFRRFQEDCHKNSRKRFPLLLFCLLFILFILLFCFCVTLMVEYYFIPWKLYRLKIQSKTRENKEKTMNDINKLITNLANTHCKEIQTINEFQ